MHKLSELFFLIHYL